MRPVVLTMVDQDDVDMLRVPFLVILGATGTGKSRLGIELAQRFAGEIISADSMQVYKDLDIVTAKVTKEEKEMVPHHMVDIVDPLTNFSVYDFASMAHPIINDLMARKKMPLIVGGTNYYIESLLWEYLIPPPKMSSLVDRQNGTIERLKNERKSASDDRDGSHGNLETEMDDECPSKKRSKVNWNTEMTNEELHRRLTEIDPEMAMKLHPNDTRKVIRSLEVYEQHGVTHTELLKAQRQSGGYDFGGPLRHPNSVILWLRCEPKVLDERLERRVDGMLEVGLLKELLDFHRRYNEQRIKSNTTADYTKGIFQTIGFKEFHNYLILPEEERNSKKGEKLLQQGIHDLKIVTKRYARRQNKWVMSRIILANRQVPPVYTLDCTDVEQWNSRVYEPAVEIISAIMQGKKPEQKSLNDDIEDRRITDRNRHYCEICDRVFISDRQWHAHINGRRHSKVVKQKKMEKQKEECEKEKEECEKEKQNITVTD